MVTKTSLPTDWEFVKAIDHIDFIRGQEPGSKHYNIKGHGQRFIRVGDLSGKREEVIFTDLSNLSSCKKSDILMSFDGSPGIVRRGFEGIYSSGIRKIILKNTIFDRNFTYYALQSSIVQDLIAIHADAGTTIKHAGKSIPHIRIPAPPISEQKKIAAILSSVDNAIQATQAMIDQTHRVKQGLMQQLLTRGIGHTRFKQTEIVNIPEGWEVRKLSTVAHIQTGIAKGKKCLEDPIELPYLRVANVQDGYIDITEIKTINISKREVERYSLQEGDVLLTEGGDFDKLGRGDVWHGQIEHCLHQNHVFAVRTDRSAILPEFYSAQASSVYGKKYFLSCAKQTTNLASINSTQLKNFPTIIPPLEEQIKIIKILYSIRTEEELAKESLNQLEKIKRGLKQDLLTGRVRVKLDGDATT